ncbi:Uncharacterized protein Fot_24699 [Forsythia ovata]|uniref:Uncharacterized protein n=1 Tax=Forsythia ovata TaxID=205694 RepID=A0ABD1U714_9LAMI
MGGAADGGGAFWSEDHDPFLATITNGAGLGHFAISRRRAEGRKIPPLCKDETLEKNISSDLIVKMTRLKYLRSPEGNGRDEAKLKHLVFGKHWRNKDIHNHNLTPSLQNFINWKLLPEAVQKQIKKF